MKNTFSNINAYNRVLYQIYLLDLAIEGGGEESCIFDV